MIHSGSRGLGHQLCSDYLQQIQADKSASVHPNDRQLTGIRVSVTNHLNYCSNLK